jgi:hypothetical protein
LQQRSQNKKIQGYPSDSLYLTQMQPQLALLSKIAENPKEAPAELLSTSPFFQTTLQDDALRQCNFQRPSTAPALHSSDIHDFWIPPRQELPFPNPKDIGNARPSSVSDLPLLPKPTPVSRVTLTANPPKTTHEEATKSPLPKPVSKKRVAQRKESTISDTQEQNDHLSSTESVAANFLTDEIVNASPEDEPSPLAAKSAAAAQSSTMSGLHSKAMAVKKRNAMPIRSPSVTKRPKMVDQSTQTQTLSGRDHTAGMRAMSTDKISDSADKSSAFTPPVDPPEIYLRHLDAFVTKLKDRAAPKELWETTGYADGDEEMRSIILNDFICENLENRDFLQLCEDTGKAWRRIGLGM